MIKIKRVYEEPETSDGYRILIDRLWPRGLSKEKANIDLWLKDIAPSDELRKWFSHDPEKWDQFRKKYREELQLKDEPLRALKDAIKNHKTVTFIYSAKDEAHNNAVFLKEYLS